MCLKLNDEPIWLIALIFMHNMANPQIESSSLRSTVLVYGFVLLLHEQGLYTIYVNWTWYNEFNYFTIFSICIENVIRTMLTQ